MFTLFLLLLLSWWTVKSIQVLISFKFFVKSFHYFYIVICYFWFLGLKLNRYKISLFLWIFIHIVFFFGVLVIMFVSFIVDLFVRIYQVSIRWYWNLFQGAILNCMWVVTKPYIRICFPCRFVEGYGKGSGWLFRLVCVNWFLCLI